jgi:hypothetical protein
VSIEESCRRLSFLCVVVECVRRTQIVVVVLVVVVVVVVVVVATNNEMKREL